MTKQTNFIVVVVVVVVVVAAVVVAAPAAARSSRFLHLGSSAASILSTFFSQLRQEILDLEAAKALLTFVWGSAQNHHVHLEAVGLI